MFSEILQKVVYFRTDNDTFTSSNFLVGLLLPQLTDEQAKLLEGPVTIKEIDQAISSLQSDKSPGADGFCAQFYKKSKVNKLLQRVFNKSFEEDELPKSIAHIIVIP